MTDSPGVFVVKLSDKVQELTISGARGILGRALLTKLLTHPNLISLATSHHADILDILLRVWGAHNFVEVAKTLDSPNPTPEQLMLLTELIHENISYTVEISPILEAVSFAMGNSTIFGTEFADERLRDAVTRNATA